MVETKSATDGVHTEYSPTQIESTQDEEITTSQQLEAELNSLVEGGATQENVDRALSLLAEEGSSETARRYEGALAEETPGQERLDSATGSRLDSSAWAAREKVNTAMKTRAWNFRNMVLQHSATFRGNLNSNTSFFVIRYECSQNFKLSSQFPRRGLGFVTSGTLRTTVCSLLFLLAIFLLLLAFSLLFVLL